ncbi:alcohol-forming fatty acyl-CoA reductase-like [Vigna radiata var. radiata]|uniref:Fatty acyl-CoA reductase n=1 Tax=Vigna radiata var. radiata TaxID=3916 RepID=A0A3Q0FLG5_VIGRR|nr:alcohol-forming fatty acyl-CoA reductase-like [Vigna radiata var. radiata]
MEFGSAQNFLEGKAILVMGATVLSKDLFRVLRGMWGADFVSFISEKVLAVGGDVSVENLGVKDTKLREKLLEETDIIINSAATTKFYERLDVAMGINTMGALNVLNFAKNCSKLQMLLHVSTAYVCAMGEQILMNMKGDIPLIIARPTVILSTYSELFPGWIEGVRTLDLFVVMYGKGKLTRSIGRRSTIIDAIPADMVINSMIVALEACSKSSSKTLIYHIGSSLRNPFRISDLEDLAHQYFTKHPLTDMYGKPVAVPKKITWMSSVSSFDRYINIRYMLALKGLNVMNKMCCYSHEAFHNESKQKVKKMMGIMRLYKPYVLFDGIFDDKNAENLRMTKMKGKDDDDVGRFNFDPTTIDWTPYMLNTHIPGLVKYGVK